MAVGERAPSASSRPAMKSSMVSRKPSGSNSAAAATSATSTTAALKGRLPVRQNASGGQCRGCARFSIRMATVSASPIRLSQNGKKPGPGPKASVSE